MSRVERKKDEAVVKKNKGRKAKFEAKMAAENDSFSEADLYTTEVVEEKKKGKFKNWYQGLTKGKKIAFISGTSVLALVLILALVAFIYFNILFEQVHVDNTDKTYDLNLVDVDGYINILLLGVDSRDMSDIRGSRSDAIMIVSINKETNDVKVLSLYRDTYLKIADTSTYDKITHACAYGGPEYSMRSLNQALDINLSNYIVVNFKAVSDLVKAVGGIVVNVQDYEIEQLNKYTKRTAHNIGDDDYNLVEKPGVQVLNGPQAVSYGRIRKGVGDDFKRTERMRKVLELVMAKLKTMKLSELKDIISMMTPQIQTNISRSDILGLASRITKYNIVSASGFPYYVTTATYNARSCVFPNTLAASVELLHKDFFEQTGYILSPTAQEISNVIAARLVEARNSKEEAVPEDEEGLLPIEGEDDPQGDNPQEGGNEGEDIPGGEETPGGGETQTE